MLKKRDVVEKERKDTKKKPPARPNDICHRLTDVACLQPAEVVSLSL
jgi:hypothetical protein